MIAALLLTLTWNGPASAATYYLSQQDFTTGTTDWQGPVAHDATDGTATASQGAFTKFGEYRPEFPGNYVAELDVYLDPTWTAGQGFEYTVASSNSSGGHLRDFVFHIASTANGLHVNGDNNTYGAGGNAFIAAQGNQITDKGWYTMQHTFRDDNGVLAVDLTLLDSDDQVVFKTTRSNAADDMSLVGGNRYGWFATNNVAGGTEMDNHELYLAADVTKDDCKDGGYANYRFSNQGQCVSWV
ncbi:hypothetical protein [Aeromicrobium sp.]|uniref:hypothetical protein n=1 Tax=Aeromicrobium sp. TaxID=1871063 RepID=UPI003D6C0F5E